MDILSNIVLASQLSFGWPLSILDGHLKKTAFGRLSITVLYITVLYIDAFWPAY